MGLCLRGVLTVRSAGKDSGDHDDRLLKRSSSLVEKQRTEPLLQSKSTVILVARADGSHDVSRRVK